MKCAKLKTYVRRTVPPEGARLGASEPNRFGYLRLSVRRSFQIGTWLDREIAEPIDCRLPCSPR
jgi:hypothetical protein